jgi:hypothetical protein
MSNEDVLKYLYALREGTVSGYSASRAVQSGQKK